MTEIIGSKSLAPISLKYIYIYMYIIIIIIININCNWAYSRWQCLQRPYIQQGNSNIARIVTVQYKYISITKHRTKQKIQKKTRWIYITRKWTLAVKPIVRRYIVWAIPTLYVKPLHFVSLHSASLSLHLTSINFSSLHITLYTQANVWLYVKMASTGFSWHLSIVACLLPACFFLWLSYQLSAVQWAKRMCMLRILTNSDLV
jgi:hypothetical protein